MENFAVQNILLNIRVIDFINKSFNKNSQQQDLIFLFD